MTNGTITTCECWYCQYEEVTCDACGAAIIPAHDAVRINSNPAWPDPAIDLCRGCIGPVVASRIAELTAAIIDRGTARMDAHDACRAACHDAEEAFWAAAAGALPAYDAAVSAARQRYKDATGKDSDESGNLFRPDRGLPF